MSGGRPPSWAANEAERNQRIEHARRLAGLRLAAVRYFEADYERSNGDADEARFVTGSAEWDKPRWRFDEGDSLDYGLELETSGGRVFSITWDPPGTVEGIGIREEPMIGHALPTGRNIAVWDVSEDPRWQSLVGNVVSDVTMHYSPWDDSGAWWCDRITLLIGDVPVELLLAEFASATQEVVPSATNVAVLIQPSRLPGWMTERSGG